MTEAYYFRQLDKAGQAAYHAMKTGPVSYTHLDVYKRQADDRCADPAAHVQRGHGAAIQINAAVDVHFVEQIDEIFGGNVPLGIGNHGAAAHAGQGPVSYTHL